MTAISRYPIGRRRFLRGAGALSVAVAGLAVLPGCGASSTTPGVTGKKRSSRLPLVGYLALHPLDRGNLSPGNQPLFGVPFADSFRQGLLDLGYVEGKTIRIEYRFAGDDTRRLEEVAQELARLPVDVLLAADTESLQAASQATHTIPIITRFSGDPVATGLVASLARPGGNVSGPSDLSTEVAAKRLEILAGAVPAMRRVGVFWNPTVLDRRLAWQQTQAAAGALNLQTRSLEIKSFDDFAPAFVAARAAQIDAFAVLIDTAVSSGFANLALFQNTYRLPGAAEGSDWLAHNGFMAYGVDEADLFRRAAGYVDRVLRGANPAELPIDRAAQFSLVFNLQAAQTLGLEIPQAVLAQATDVLK
ncbi:MAG: ABC transporter substrate-binding protein [Dehalococcoidia bacterium]